MTRDDEDAPVDMRQVAYGLPAHIRPPDDPWWLTHRLGGCVIPGPLKPVCIEPADEDADGEPTDD